MIWLDLGRILKAGRRYISHLPTKHALSAENEEAWAGPRVLAAKGEFVSRG